MKKSIPILISVLVLGASLLAGIEAAQAAGSPAKDRKPADPAAMLPNGKAPLEGVLTGGQPSRQQLLQLSKEGYKTVISLREPDEPGATTAKEVESLGMKFVALPIHHAAGITQENARRFAEILQKAGRPLVVHCASGNRVGALFALKAFYVDKKTPQEAIAIGKSAGLTGLEPVVKKKLGLE